ncbi:MAG: hypothetical protein ACRDPL_18415 [Propionibacteriaceae bacterium]
MYADTMQHSGSFERTWWRVAAVVWVAGLVAVLVGWLAAAPASAQAPPADGTVFVHSAKSGKLAGGRLILQGVGRRVTWAHHSGRNGVIAVRRLHRMLFSAKTAAATGTLHVAGHRGGDELTFKLSKPRYNRARRTVSYKAKPLNHKPLPSRAAAQAAAAARRFGAASLSIVSAPSGSVNIAQQSYGCTAGSPPSGNCYGVLTASDLQPGAHLYVNVSYSDGSPEQFDWADAEDGNGNIQNPPVYLNVPCTGTITSVQATAANGQSISLGGTSPPWNC